MIDITTIYKLQTIGKDAKKRRLYNVHIAKHLAELDSVDQRQPSGDHPILFRTDRATCKSSLTSTFMSTISSISKTQNLVKVLGLKGTFWQWPCDYKISISYRSTKPQIREIEVVDTSMTGTYFISPRGMKTS